MRLLPLGHHWSQALSVASARKYMHVSCIYFHIYLHVSCKEHTCAHTFTTTCVSMETASRECTPVCSVPSQHHRVCSGFFPSLSSSEKPGSRCPRGVYYLTSPSVYSQPAIPTTSPPHVHMPSPRCSPAAREGSDLLWETRSPPLHVPTSLCPTPGPHTDCSRRGRLN